MKNLLAMLFALSATTAIAANEPLETHSFACNSSETIGIGISTLNQRGLNADYRYYRDSYDYETHTVWDFTVYPNPDGSPGHQKLMYVNKNGEEYKWGNTSVFDTNDDYVSLTMIKDTHIIIQSQDWFEEYDAISNKRGYRMVVADMREATMSRHFCIKLDK